MSDEGIITTTAITANRIEYGTPVAYRLRRYFKTIRYPDSHGGGYELVLQGAFKWEQGSEGGIEWRDIPTVTDESA